MENKKASWGDTFRLNWRAARIWFSQYPNMFYSAAADYGLKTILPYVTIWFSAQIIDELTGSRDPNRLLKLVVLTLIVTTVMALLQAVAHRWFDGTPRKLLDVSKATALGWTYQTELEDGIRLSYEDFLNNPMRAER